ncbi:MAG: hypothetical protein PHW23_01690 [Bacilli bacterium]|nr:hypothetical protein [Bacilli bacterium]
MKKWMFLPIVLISLSGCNSIDNPYSIRVCQNIDFQVNEGNPTFNEVSNIDLFSLINSNSAFALFLYSESCNYCESAKETLSTYVNKNNFLIYSYEYVTQAYNNLVSSFPSIFPNQPSIPSLYLISEKSLTYSFDTKVLFSYSNFRPVADQHIFNSYIQTFFEQSSFDYIIENQRENFVFLYGDSSLESLSIFNEVIYPLAISQKVKYVTLLDENALNSDIISSISEYYQIDVEARNIALYKNKNGVITSTLYLLDNGLELVSLIKTYMSE